MSSRFAFSGAISLGVTEKARTPSSVVGSNLTRNRSHVPGSLPIDTAAEASIIDFHSSAVFGRDVEEGRGGAAIIFRISGLTVVGVGTVRAGNSNSSETDAGPFVCGMLKRNLPIPQTVGESTPKTLAARCAFAPYFPRLLKKNTAAVPQLHTLRYGRRNLEGL
jgi:hypothetical protein